MIRFTAVQKGSAWAAVLSGLLVLMTLAGAASAADKPFYAGKTIRVIVPFSPGGGTDNYARFAARHWVKYIPGNPRILVQNMPGGGGALTFGYLYSKASRDGLTLGVASEGVPVRRLLRRPGHTYEFIKMSLIASAPGFHHTLCRQEPGHQGAQ